MKLALWQPRSVPCRLEELGERLAALLEEASREGCRLVLTPELLCSPSPEEPGMPSDGPLARLLQQSCRSCRIGAAIGYRERYLEWEFSSILLFSPEGIAVGNYRRTHLRPGEEGRLAAGRWLTLAPFDGHRIGLLLGADLELPEPARCLVHAGAQIILVGGERTPRTPQSLPHLVATRAFENRVPVVHAGPPGTVGLAAGPEGPLRIEGRGEWSIVEIEEGGTLTDNRHPKPQPQLYGILLKIDEFLSRLQSG